MDFPLVVNSTSSADTLLVTRPGVAIPYISLLGVAALGGTLGNALIIGTLLLWRGSPTVGNLFIVNLACSDIIVTAVINPFAIIGVVEGVHFFDGKEWLCTALASICVASCVVSLLSIGCISVNRFIYICHHGLYHRVYSRRKCVTMCLLTWVCGFLLDLPSHVGWSRHTFDTKSHKCLWDRNLEYSYTCFFVVGGVLVPLAIITFCYVRIFVHMGVAKQKLAQLTNQDSHRTMIKTIRQARMMFVIFLAFTFCWTPYIIVLLMDKDDVYSMPLHLYSSLTAHVHASINFIIYGIANRKIRRGYQHFIREKLCCLKYPWEGSGFIRAESAVSAPESTDFISIKRKTPPAGLSRLLCWRSTDAHASQEVVRRYSNSSGSRKSACRDGKDMPTDALLAVRRNLSVTFSPETFGGETDGNTCLDNDPSGLGTNDVDLDSGKQVLRMTAL